MNSDCVFEYEFIVTLLSVAWIFIAFTIGYKIGRQDKDAEP